jgi:hypothetical protein
MVAEFEAAAFALENPGDITPAPVQSQFGYHIIQLIARQERPVEPGGAEAARDQAFTEWLASTRSEYTVETYDDFWIGRVPTEPNFITLATESAAAARTQEAESASQATATQE